MEKGLYAIKVQHGQRILIQQSNAPTIIELRATATKSGSSRDYSSLKDRQQLS